MLFMVLSNPLYSRPEEIAEAKVEFVKWLKDLKTKKKLVNAYQRIGKGSAVIFDVDSNEELNQLMNEWLNMLPVPVTYEIVPLVVTVEI